MLQSENTENFCSRCALTATNQRLCLIDRDAFARRDFKVYDMKRTMLRSLTLVAAVMAIVGCQSGPRFAWFKREKSPEESSAVARSAKPTLPSAQSTPQAVAVNGLTPAAPPSSTNLAAASGATTPGALGGLSAKTAPLATATPTTPPATTPIPPSSAITATQPPGYPTDSGLADKLVSTPKTAGATTPAAPPSALASNTSATTTPASVPATPGMTTAGPYDPGAYKPSTSMNPATTTSSEPADRYAMSSTPPFPAPAAQSPPYGSTSLNSDPADRYGTPGGAVAAASVTPAAAMSDPSALAADRYANPRIPTLPTTTATAQSAPAPSVSAPLASTAPPAVATAIPTTNAVPAGSAVRLASAPGQYRPGRTSSYIPTSATIPVEIASRPAPASTSAPPSAVTPAAPNSVGTPSQPWAPPTATPATTGTRTY